MELTTRRLQLRPFTLADHDAIHAIYADAEVMRYVGAGAHATLAETAAALRTYGDVLAAPRLLVPRRDRARRAARSSATPGCTRSRGTGPDVELGYTLARGAWGQRLRDRGCGSALVDHAFGPLGVPRVVAQVEPGNPASRRVLDKLGMDGARAADGLRPPAPALRARARLARRACAARVAARGEAREQRLGEPVLGR